MLVSRRFIITVCAKFVENYVWGDEAPRPVRRPVIRWIGHA